MPRFSYQDPFPVGKDDTKYKLLTKGYVSVANFEGKKILKVDPKGLEYLLRLFFISYIPAAMGDRAIPKRFHFSTDECMFP